MRLLLFALALASCYSPNPPSGAYLCGVDGSCPSSQSCVCGQCVRKAADAACAFTVNASGAGTPNEHQQFSITVTAYQQDKTTPASGYNGTVDLSFRLPDGSKWCDVTPSTATLSGGSATLSVSLNRETIPPQTPLLTATGPGGASGSTGKVVVLAPPLVKDDTAIVDPAHAGAAFGWADAVVAEPAVIKVPGEGYRMYFTGAGSGTTGIGVATSTDGKSFTAKPAPVLTVTPGTFYSMSVTSAAVYPAAGGGWSMLFAGGTMAFSGDNVNDQLGIASSADGLSTFVVGNGGNPVLRNSMPGPPDCNYCADSLDFPSVLPLPAAADGGTSDSGTLMFFAARQKGSLESIARASLQGTRWVPEPSPVLEGDVGGEALLLAPVVLLDGSVYKMWYSFARLADFKTGQSFCDTPVYIGYATSSDGLYWVRSPSNRNALGLTATGWDAGMPALLAGSVIPLGDDPSSGVALYYSVWRKTTVGATMVCIAPNGIGRATRP
jgi:hypothetical protein